jgi:hypothetical protein
MYGLGAGFVDQHAHEIYEVQSDSKRGACG